MNARKNGKLPCSTSIGTLNGANGPMTRPGGKPSCAPWKLWQARPICLRLFWQFIRLADSRTFWIAGRSRPIRMPIMAMTTSSSIRVNAFRDAQRNGMAKLLMAQLPKSEQEREELPIDVATGLGPRLMTSLSHSLIDRLPYQVPKTGKPDAGKIIL